MENIEMDLTDKGQLLKYIKENGIWAKKGLSQNFLIDKVALEKIVSTGELDDKDAIIEVGPGLGTLTQELIAHAGRVIAIEKDDKLANLLASLFSKSEKRPEIINDDILSVNISKIVGDKPYKVIANIPYAITSKIIRLFLTLPKRPEKIVMLVQKEVAERICALPGEMSILSVSVQVYGEPEIVAIVPKESFFPAPKVDSAILQIGVVQNVLQPEIEKEFFRVVHIGFSSKRKKLINNLSAGYHLPKDKVLDIIKTINLSPELRAEDLSIEDWLHLTNKLKNI